MVQRRSVATAIILTIITCGLYGIYWMIVINDDINTLCDRHSDLSGGVVFLLHLITCGIFGIYWCYKMGDNLDRKGREMGEIPQYRGILYLVLCLFGFGIISVALMQDSVNKMI